MARGRPEEDAELQKRRRGRNIAMLVVLTSYVSWVWSAPREIGQGEWKVHLPSGPSTLLQICIGILDLGFCALAMYMLLPDEPNVGFVTMAVVFVSAGDGAKGYNVRDRSDSQRD